MLRQVLSHPTLFPAPLGDDDPLSASLVLPRYSRVSCFDFGFFFRLFNLCFALLSQAFAPLENLGLFFATRPRPHSGDAWGTMSSFLGFLTASPHFSGFSNCFFSSLLSFPLAFFSSSPRLFLQDARTLFQVDFLHLFFFPLLHAQISVPLRLLFCFFFAPLTNAIYPPLVVRSQR